MKLNDHCYAHTKSKINPFSQPTQKECNVVDTITIEINANCCIYRFLLRNFFSFLQLFLIRFLIFFVLSFNIFPHFLYLLCFWASSCNVFIYSQLLLLLSTYSITFTASHDTYESSCYENTFLSEDRFRKTLKSLLKFSCHC